MTERICTRFKYE